MKYFIFAVVFVLAFSFSAARSQWIPTNGPEPSLILSAGTAGNIFLAGTDLYGPYRSTDSGLSWTSIPLGVSPFQRPQVFSITQIGRYTLAGSSDFIFRSTDSGLTWTLPDSERFGSANFSRLLSLNGSVYAIAYFNEETGIFRSTDSGSTWKWEKLNLGYYTRIFEMCVVDTQIVVSTDSSFYYLDDRAASWKPMPRGPTSLGSPISSIGHYLFAGGGLGIARTSDLGKTWTICDSVKSDYFSLFYSDSSGIYSVRSKGRIFHSSDSGNTWLETDAGLTAEEIYSLQSHGSMLIAATDLGIFRSSDAGHSWVASNNGMPMPEVSSVLVNDSQLFALSPRSGAFFSSDYGNHWKNVSYALGANGYRFSALVQVGNRVFLSSTFATYSTQDQGQSWSTQPSKIQVASFGLHGSTLLAGCYDGVIRSTDSGRTWGDTTIFLFPNVGHTEVNGFAFSGSMAFIATDGGVGVSSDDGRTWGLTLNWPQPYVHSVAADHYAVYAATQRGLYRSTDSGQHWSRADASFNYGYADTSVRALSIVDGNVFASTDYDVYVSRDHGERWISAGSGLAAVAESFAVSKTDLFAGTSHGVWRRPLSEIIRPESVRSPEATPTSITCYPNPLVSAVTIMLNSDVASHVDIAIVNSLGVEAAHVFSGAVKAGLSSFRWQAPIGLPAGVYQCRARLNDVQVSAGMIVE